MCVFEEMNAETDVSCLCGFTSQNVKEGIRDPFLEFFNVRIGWLLLGPYRYLYL